MAEPRTAPPKNRGFTLLEVIIAFIIMALIVGATFDTFSSGLRGAALSDHYAGAVIRAESQLALIDRAEPLEVGVRTGRFDRIYTWRAEIAPVVRDEAEAPQESPYALFDVIVSVFWKEGRDTRDVTLRSRRFRTVDQPG